MTKDEALKMCLEYIETDAHERKYVRHAIKEALAQPEHGWTPERIAGIARLKDAQDKRLAQPEQEPVAWVSSEELLVMRGNALGGAKDWRINVGLVKQDGDVGLYTTPPQRTWVGLTDEEIDALHMEVKVQLMGTFDTKDIYRAIEAKLKEKNT